MKKILICILLMITTVSSPFAIPAKPFKLLALRDLSYLDIKGFDEQKAIEPISLYRSLLLNQ